MKNSRLTYAITIGLVFLIGCTGSSPLVKFVKEGGLETKGLVNLASASSGARVILSQDNPDHPGSTLINGITFFTILSIGIVTVILDLTYPLLDPRIARGGEAA